MNEITHEQARRLMQQDVDGLLDEGGFARQEWANLHAHLENCSECRAAERTLRTLARDLHGAIRHGLDDYEPPPVTVGPLMEARSAREATKMGLTRLAVGGPLILVALFLAFILRPDRLLVALLDPWGTAAKEFYASFDGQIAFVSKRDGNSEIYLLKSGSAAINLTNNPSEDTMPLWSPDGAWLAFYSDRAADPLNARAQEPRDLSMGANIIRPTATPARVRILSIGKREVFLLDPANRSAEPVQISAEPGIAWQSPPAWSPDGKTLIAAGRIGAAVMELVPPSTADDWLYAMGLDGAPAERIAGTQGASLPRFSPNGRWLGYIQEHPDRSEIRFRSLTNPDLEPENLFETDRTPGIEFRAGSNFTWSPGGSDLAYIVEGPFLYTDKGYTRAVSQLRRTNGSPESMPDYQVGDPLVELPVVNGLRDVTWSPDAATLVMLQGSTQDPCLTLLVGRSPREAGAAMDIYPVDGLCAEGVFSARPWTPDGRWLIFTGRWRSGAAYIYALDVKQVIDHPNSAPLVARLTDGFSTDSQPQVQPEYINLRLQPQPVAERAVGLPFSGDLRDTAPGRLLVTGYNDQTGTDIYALAPAGITPAVVSSLPGYESSPVWAPGGRRAAWIGFTASPDAIAHLYVGDMRALELDPPQKPVLSSEPPLEQQDVPVIDLTPGGVLRTSPPVWAPDGLSLAVILNSPLDGSTNDISQIAIFSADGDPAKNRYIAPREVVFLGPIAWSPPGSKTGQYIAALVTGDLPGDAAGAPLALALVDLTRGGQSQPRLIYQPVENTDPSQVRGLAFSPDGSRVALLSLFESGGRWIPRVGLFDVNGLRQPQYSSSAWFEEFIQTQAETPADSEQLMMIPGNSEGLRWRPGTDEVSFAVNNFQTVPPTGQIVLYNTAGGKAEGLVEWHEMIFQHAWSPDGAWLAFNTESGLYLVNVDAARQGAAPVRLINATYGGFNWGP